MRPLRSATGRWQLEEDHKKVHAEIVAVVSNRSAAKPREHSLPLKPKQQASCKMHPSSQVDLRNRCSYRKRHVGQKAADRRLSFFTRCNPVTRGWCCDAALWRSCDRIANQLFHFMTFGINH